MANAPVSKTGGSYPVRVQVPLPALGDNQMEYGNLIQGSWSASYGQYNGTLTIRGPYQYPDTGGTYTQSYPYQPSIGIPGGTCPQSHPYQPSTGVPGPIGLPGVQGPPGMPIEPSEEMIKIATKLLHDPDFEVGKFLARILAKHLLDHMAEYAEDEVVKKYLPGK